MIIKSAKKLLDCLQTKVVLETASAAPLKLGGVENLHQFHILGNARDKFLLQYGPGAPFELSADEAFEKLAAVIAEFKKVRFHLLWLPIAKGVDHCTADISGNVIMRTIEFYEVRLDEMLTRYDVLVRQEL